MPEGGRKSFDVKMDMCNAMLCHELQLIDRFEGFTNALEHQENSIGREFFVLAIIFHPNHYTDLLKCTWKITLLNMLLTSIGTTSDMERLPTKVPC